jgi:hypothetical protein
VQTPPNRYGPPPGAPTLTPPSPFRSVAQDDLTRAVLVLLIVTCVGLIVVDRVVNRLAPDGIPASGIASTAAHVHPVFEDIPSRVQTNGKPLMVTLRATNTRVDIGYTASRYIFLVDPPNEPSLTLCDGDSPICSLPLDGSPRQRGTWTVTLRIYDNEGNIADTRTRLRVT